MFDISLYAAVFNISASPTHTHAWARGKVLTLSLFTDREVLLHRKSHYDSHRFVLPNIQTAIILIILISFMQKLHNYMTHIISWKVYSYSATIPNKTWKVYSAEYTELPKVSLYHDLLLPYHTPTDRRQGDG